MAFRDGNGGVLLHIPVYNMNGSPNETDQISEVVDIVLCYKTHSERMLCKRTSRVVLSKF